MKKIGLLFLIALATTSLRAQNPTPNQIIPYDFQFYQKLNKSVYSQDNRVHSSIRGFYADDSHLSMQFDSLMNYGLDTLNKRSWAHRKLFNEHLLEFKNEDYFIYADFLPDFTIGREFEEGKTTWLIQEVFK